MFPFDHPENLRFFDVFSGDQKRTLGRKGLNKTSFFVYLVNMGRRWKVIMCCEQSLPFPSSCQKKQGTDQSEPIEDWLSEGM